MSMGSITAGKVYWELTSDDSKLQQGLRKAQASIRGLEYQLGNVGKGMVTLSATIAAPLALMVRSFASIGDEAAKTARAIGITTEAFTNLAYAARRSGATTQDVSNGMGRMARNISDAGNGLTTSIRAFDRIGLSVDTLFASNPEEQFKMIAQAMSELESPTLMAATAQEIFGRGGKKLIPLLLEGADGIKRLAKENEILGGTLSTKTTTGAEVLTDAFEDMGVAAKAISIVVGESLLPIILSYTKRLISATIAIRKFVGRNRNAVIVLAKLAATIGIVGLSLIALARTISILNAALVLLTKHPLVALLTLIGAALVGVATYAGLAATGIDDINKELDKMIAKAEKATEVTRAFSGISMDGMTAVDNYKESEEVKKYREALEKLHKSEQEYIQKHKNDIEERYNLEKQSQKELFETEKTYNEQMLQNAIKVAEIKRRIRKDNSDLYAQYEDLLLQTQYEGVELAKERLKIEEKIAIQDAKRRGLDVEEVKRIFALQEVLLNKSTQDMAGTVRGMFAIAGPTSFSSSGSEETRQLKELRNISNSSKDTARNTLNLINSQPLWD